MPASTGAADDGERRRAAFPAPVLLAARHHNDLLLLHANRCAHAVDIYTADPHGIARSLLQACICIQWPRNLVACCGQGLSR